MSIRAAGCVLRSGGLAMLLLLAGCSSPGSISGKITYKGQPLKSGTVTFVPDQGGGYTSDVRDGQYKIEKIPPGPAKIAVIPTSTTAPMEYLMKMRPPKEVMEKAVPGKSIEGQTESTPDKSMEKKPKSGPKIETPFPVGKFKDPNTSGLTYTVKSGPQVYDIELPDK
jgi:hypothetical protein